jgi:hypothetical protein
MVITGLMFVTGLLEFTVKEITVVLFKIALVTTFAFNTDMALGVAYKFFLGMTQTAVGWFSVIAVTPPNLGGAGDARILGMVNPSSPQGCEFTGAAGVMGWFLIGLAALLVLPLVAGVFVMAFISLLAFFARAGFGYLYSLVMLTFLIAAMPIFVGFALFSKTRAIFDGWVTELFSNALQIILVFGFLAWIAGLPLDFITDIGRLLTSYTVGFSTPPLSFLVGDLGTVCSICTPNIIDDPVYLAKGFKFPVIADSPNQCLNPDALSWFEILGQDKFIYYLVTQGTGLFVVASVMDELMKDVPDMAKKLAGGGGLTIGGIARNYNPANPGNSLSAPGFTNATVNFEKGAIRAFSEGKTFNTEGKNLVTRVLYRTTPMRIAAALMGGSGDIKYGASQLTKREVDGKKKRAAKDKADNAQKVMTSKSEVKRQEANITTLEEAKKQLQKEQEEHLRKIEELRAEAEAAKLSGKPKSAEMQDLEKKILKSESALIDLRSKQVTLLQDIKKQEIELNALSKKTPATQKERVAQKTEIQRMQENLRILQEQQAKNTKERIKTAKERDELYKQQRKLQKREQDRELAQLLAQQEKLRKELEEEKERKKNKEEEEDFKKQLKDLEILEQEILAKQEAIESEKQNALKLELIDVDIKDLEQNIEKIKKSLDAMPSGAADDGTYAQLKAKLLDAEQKLDENYEKSRKLYLLDVSPDMAELKYEVAKKTLEENKLALSENEVNLTKAGAELKSAEEAMKGAESQAAEDERRFNDPRYLRHRSDGKGGYLTHGGLIDDMWGTATDAKYFASRADEYANRKTTWSSMLHVGDDHS